MYCSCLKTKQVRGVCFDIGNVLCEVDLNEFFQAFSTVFRTEEIEGWRFLRRIQESQDIGLTSLTLQLELYHPNLKKGEKEFLLDAWNKCIRPNQIMIEFVKQLRNHGFQVALLSNMGVDHANYLDRICPELMENCINHLSYMVGARKPTKLFFQSFILENPGFFGCLYVDDIKENLDTGRFWLNPEQFSLSEFNQLDDFFKQARLKKLLQSIRRSVGEGWDDDSY